jgi:phosphoglycerol transferase MdoB-like AlkP superfamily enzyme
MFAQEWIEACSMAFNTTTVGAGILISIILVVTVDLLIIVVMKNKSAMPMTVIDTFLVIGLVWAQWLPSFTGSALAILMALLSAYVVKERI